MYLSQLFAKLSEFGHHHQIFFTMLAALAVILISWGIERILDLYIFPERRIYGYLTAIASGLVLLWVIQHLILNVF